MQPTIIIFTGLPATGKTTLSKNIAKALNIPLFAKDAIKEIMYDTIGWSDKAFSAKLAQATFGIMDLITEQQLQTGRSLILESNYSPKLASNTFRAWQKEYNCKIIQVVCQTDVSVLAKRYVERQHIDRHPGHNDNVDVAGCAANFRQRIANGEDQPLDVEGKVLVVDTTHFDAVDTGKITGWIQNNI